MTLLYIGLALLALLFLGVPVAFSLAGLGAALLMLKGLPLAMVAQNLHGALDNFVLLSVPLFLLMSNLLLKGGVGKDLFDAVQKWVGHLPGGLGLSALVSCGIFSAISGSSVATAATVGTVAIPEMAKHGYSKHFTLGLLAAGGTLGILIPPSIPLIVYGVITDESIGKLFLAGVGPGILLLVMFSIYTVGYAWFTGLHQGQEASSMKDRMSSTVRAMPTILLAVLIIGGIYTGAFTPTEASAVGALASFVLVAFILRTLSLKDFYAAVSQTLKTTIVLFLIVIGAKIFGKAITLYQVPFMLSELVDVHISSVNGFMLLVTAILLVIGLFLESLSMLLIMVPVLFPTVLSLGIDPIWFGIYFVILIELALITPPVGLNLFVIQAIARTNLGVVARGVIPFIFIMLAGAVIVYFVPAVVTWIPNNL
ncbi:TRAP transporter large permease [Allopusillimonas ginsengisoli]|uniref:TRAP transporter large permease n=1 Tax=Allopusillimonas ginsengisoli TaxID=453575 RepID=UPI0010C1F402|nr:TRAP transporter large permease [Allopusillimonas ginsengisoli]